MTTPRRSAGPHPATVRAAVALLAIGAMIGAMVAVGRSIGLAVVFGAVGLGAAAWVGGVDSRRPGDWS
ncbi:MAG: hypothetical protein KatS3mg013_0802 [Actinomycetota bacterium]|jgi:hypothetical protein|nr:MAG: hypothetical protein KatS3mg013_0802 [Actinomycetota bacterium]